MALGVEGAMVICPFMTEKYQESESCKLELSYAKDLEVQVCQKRNCVREIEQVLVY